MSAAAPAPPPHLYPSQPTRSTYRGTSEGSRDVVSGGTPPNGRANGGSRPLPHIKDIVAKAEDQVDIYASIKTILERISQASAQAKTMLSFNRPDLAYSEYLVATILLANVVPHHKDFPSINPRLLREITSRHHADQQEFDRVKDLIKHDNLINGTEPQGDTSQPAPIQAVGAYHAYASSSNTQQYTSDRRPQSMQAQQNGHSAHSDIGGHRNSIATPQRSSSTELSKQAKPRPPVNPKPQNLHGSAINAGSMRSSGVPAQLPEDADALADRFARLREGGLASSNQAASQSGNLPDASSSSRSSGSYHQAPNGSFKNSTVNTSISRSSNLSKELPKPPSPTYSPVRTTAPAIQPARASKSSVNSSTTDRPSSSASSRDSMLYRTSTNGTSSSQHAESLNGQQATTRRRRKTINLPQETEISAEKLFDYLKTFNVLLIDVRSREDYDAGHIFAAASMCVEPAALRPNMSADQLQEALILSPEKEQDMLFQREKFDLVVYYDQSTSASPFQRSHRRNENPALRYLHDALCEFNHDKPLFYPPLILAGGLEAWVQLMGEHALEVSDTVGIRAAKASGAPPRRPASNSVSRFSVPRKRHRDYNPLDPEEETKWRERARSESVVLDSQPQVEEESQEDGSAPQFMRTYEEFYQRFPDVASVEAQSMISHPPTRMPPQPPPPPRAAPAPPSAPLPSIPSRPPPALSRPSYSGVSERVVTNTTPSLASAKLPVYIPPKMLRLPRTGLYNFGATCYMNATIQCLSATIPLTSFFLDGQWHKYLQKSNWKGSKGIIPQFYEILLRNLWTNKGDVDTIRPTNFRKFCARLNKEWGSDRQQDAKEFLEFLLDCLHEDFNANWAHSPLQTLTAQEEAKREGMPPFQAAKIEWSRYLHRDNSRITDLFAGQHISRLQCTTCKNSSTTYEPFYSISVEIPYSRGRSVDIHDCMRSYCSAEMLSGEEVWRCPHCRAEREATKRITFSRAPEVLVIHFKRFSASHSEKGRKIMTPIEFPLTNFDLEPYMIHSPDDQQRDDFGRTHGGKGLEKPWSMTPPYRYDAYAIIRHLGGTMTSGHYISLVKDQARGRWREFNDDRIQDFQPESLPPNKRLQNEQAYIVFYQRVNTGAVI